jgi:hypothetical protein
MIGSHKLRIRLGGQGGRIGDCKGGLGGRERGFQAGGGVGGIKEVLGDSGVRFDDRSKGREAGK